MTACSKCGKEAIAKLRYNQTSLCAPCFCQQFEDRVRQANRDFRLFKLNQRIAVGASGGKDSSAMLWVLAKKIIPGVHGSVLLPVLIDEGIQGYRNGTKKKAEALCDLLGLELNTYSYKGQYLEMDEVMKTRDARAKTGHNFHGRRSCTYCGVFRKSMLNKAALDLQADVMAIGHNADDVAQTFLMNVMRNESEKRERFEVANEGKAGFVPRVKPLVYNLEEECALYCELQNIPYYPGKCPYANESFRGEIKDFLNELENKFPGVKFNVMRSFFDLQKMEKKKKGEAEEAGGEATTAILQCNRCGQNSSQETCQACTFVSELTHAF